MAKTVVRPRAAWQEVAAQPRERDSSRAQQLWLAAPVALCVCAFALRLYRLDHEPLWLDEGYTLLFSGLPLDRLIAVGGAHEHPPLYYLLVHLIMSFRHSYLAPRVLSAVFGSLAVPALFALGSRLGGPRTGLAAAALLTVSPFHVWFSQDGRGYELAGLAVILSYVTGFAALDRPRKRAWALYAMCTALCLYAEYTTVFALLPQLMFLVRARRRAVTRGLLLAWGGAALLFVPWLGTLLFDAAAIAGNYWIPPPNPTTVSNTVLEFLGVLTPCPGTPCTGTELGLPLLAGHEVALAALALVAGVMAGLCAARYRNFTAGVLVLWLIVPFVVVITISIGQSLYLDRVFLDVTFPLYLLLGLGFARARRSAWLVASIGAIALAAASLANLGPIYAGGTNPDWRSAARDFQAAYRPGQAVIFNPGVLGSLVSSYLPAGWQVTRERALWSRSYVDVPGWQKYYPTVFHPSKKDRARIEAVLRSRQLAETARGEQQVWLVTYDYPGLNDTRHWFLGHGFQLSLSEEYLGDTRIELWSRAGPSKYARLLVDGGALGGAWRRSGAVSVFRGVAQTRGPAQLSRTFAVRPGVAYSVAVEYKGIPPARPLVSLQTYDSAGRRLDAFPRTQWYDWPSNGVWLSQPFGFVAPPNATRAVLRLQTLWGRGAWRHIDVYGGL